jgi:uncharacterized sulfatase
MSRSAVVLLGLLLAPTLPAADRPNILWLVAEDMGPHLGAYGSPDAITPHLDALAAEGTRFDRVFAVAGVCAPSRSSLITGRYASTLGAQHMRSVITLPADVRVFPALLREAGYYCTNNFKQDYNFPAPADAWDDSSRTAHWRARPEGRPFFSVFNFMTTHEQHLRAAPEAFARLTARLTPEQRRDPARVTLPGWLPDTPAVRTEWARYHEMITAMDAQAGDLLRQLEADGLADDTIVMFFSDHGAGFPRAKQFLTDAGTRVPLVIRCPPRWRHLLRVPGGASDRLVSLFDLAPTVLSVAGVAPPTGLQARAFLGPHAAPPRTVVHGIRDRMDERIDLSRSVHDGRFRYQRNYRPDLPRFPWLDYMDQLATAKEFRRLAQEGTLPAGLRPFLAPRQEIEELYDTELDPNEWRNLASDPAHAGDLERLRAAHDTWVRETRDTGFIPEQMLRDFAAAAGSEFAHGQSDAYALERCLATARLVEQGSAAVPRLREALRDDYGPVRYWAAVGLGVAGAREPGIVADLGGRLQDPHAEVALAAAEALGRLGTAAAALPVVARWVEHGRPLEALAAANVADRLGAAARPIADVLRRVAALKPDGDLGLMRQWVLLHALRALDAPWRPVARAADLVDVGLARVDITPAHPVRLHAFPRGDRVPETTAVAQRIHAQALAIGRDEEGPVVLVTADLLGIGEEMSAALATRLARRAGLTDRSRLTFTATHNHSAPGLPSVAPYVFRDRPTPEAAANLARYEAWVLDRLEEVVLAALRDRRPAQLHQQVGTVAIAVNRRVVADGKWQGFGVNPAGATDHDLPLLAVHAPDGALRGVWLSHACHGVCWRRPSIHGDWMGVARRLIERDHPGALALISIGCAGDQNPTDAEGNDPDTPGRAVALEAARLLAQPGRPVLGVPRTRLERFSLPLEPVPGLDQWQRPDDWFAGVMRARLTAGEVVPAEVPYVVQTWTFASGLEVVFLAGEVFAEYGRRLKRDRPPGMRWTVAYANAMPGYVPTAAALQEGGFEVDASRRSYGLPARFQPRTEELLLERVAAFLRAATGAGPAAPGTGEDDGASVRR